MSKVVAATTNILLLLLLVVVQHSAEAWTTKSSIVTSRSTRRTQKQSIEFRRYNSRTTELFNSENNDNAIGGRRRRDFLFGAAAIVVGTIPLQSVHAMGVDYAAANIVTDQLAATSNLRIVKLSLKKIVDAESQLSDYAAMKSVLREYPVSDIRKACTSLIRVYSSSDTSLDSKYKSFVNAVETFDSTTSVAMRGRKVSDTELYTSYQAVCTTLQDFITAVTDAAAVAAAPL